MFHGATVLVSMLLIQFAVADILAPAEIGVEKTVQVFQRIIGRTITSKTQAIEALGSEGAVLFGSVRSLESRGLAGNLRTVNYTELSKTLKANGVSGMEFVQQIQSLAGGNAVVSMNELVTMGTKPGLPQPRSTDRLAIIDRLAPQALDRFRTPTTPSDVANQASVASLLGAAEEGAKLCTDRALCRTNNVASVVEMDRLQLLGRGLTVQFARDAFLGFPNDAMPYRDGRLHAISTNLRAALSGAGAADAIEPAGVRSCVLTGKPELN